MGYIHRVLCERNARVEQLYGCTVHQRWECWNERENSVSNFLLMKPVTMLTIPHTSDHECLVLI